MNSNLVKQMMENIKNVKQLHSKVAEIKAELDLASKEKEEYRLKFDKMSKRTEELMFVYYELQKYFADLPME